LQALVARLAERIGRALQRRGVLVRDTESVSAGRKLHTDGGPILHTSPAAAAVI
jgi:hypothetical protein